MIRKQEEFFFWFFETRRWSEKAEALFFSFEGFSKQGVEAQKSFQGKSSKKKSKKG
jgi:hypothetical protein